MSLNLRTNRWLAVFIVIASAYASSGDREQEFQDCLSLCQSHNCLPPNGPSLLPLSLRLTLWSCLDDCKYTCMHLITDRAIANDGRIQQYYGKWPFWRLYGMQEPASVLFSLLNLWGHVRGARLVARRIPNGHPMKQLYLLWAMASTNAWLWSSVFHTRDTSFTEKMDYFSAALAILFALYYTVIRLFHLYPHPERSRLTTAPTHPSSLNVRSHYFAWSALCTLTYLAHVSYLSLLPRFDYTYNMAFNLTIGLTHNLLWILYALPAPLVVLRRFSSRSVPRGYRPPYAGKAALFVALTTAATALELFDFPPWARAVDAHALWHLATVPIVPFWYAFLVEDALDEGWRVGKT